MPKPAFLIEGHMEKKILQVICPGSPIRRIECNGDDVSMIAMAKFIETHIRLFNNRYHPIVIVFDREGRETNCTDLRRTLTDELRSRGIKDEIIIGIPDRSIENWILSDRAMIRQWYNVNCPETNYEGDFGKRRLKSILKDRYSYHETTLGVEMFLHCSPAALCENSASFRTFARKINFNCDWLES